jgi:hypothetical protein
MPEVTPEQDARVTIDALLDAVRRSVQSVSELNIFTPKDVAVRYQLGFELMTHAHETWDTRS